MLYQVRDQLDVGFRKEHVKARCCSCYYINDLPSASQFNTTLFADDTLLMLADKNLDMLESKVNEQIQDVDY